MWLLRRRGRVMKRSLVGVGMVVVMILGRRGVVRDKGCRADLALGGEALDFLVDREVRDRLCLVLFVRSDGIPVDRVC